MQNKARVKPIHVPELRILNDPLRARAVNGKHHTRKQYNTNIVNIVIQLEDIGIFCGANVIILI